MNEVHETITPKSHGASNGLRGSDTNSSYDHASRMRSSDPLPSHLYDYRGSVDVTGEIFSGAWHVLLTSTFRCVEKHSEHHLPDNIALTATGNFVYLLLCGCIGYLVVRLEMEI